MSDEGAAPPASSSGSILQFMEHYINPAVHMAAPIAHGLHPLGMLMSGAQVMNHGLALHPALSTSPQETDEHLGGVATGLLGMTPLAPLLGAAELAQSFGLIGGHGENAEGEGHRSINQVIGGGLRSAGETIASPFQDAYEWMDRGVRDIYNF